MNVLAMRQAWNSVQDKQALLQAVHVLRLQALHVKLEVKDNNTEFK